MAKQMKTYRYTNAELSLMAHILERVTVEFVDGPASQLLTKIRADLAHRAKVAERNRTQPRPCTPEPGDVIPRETATTLYRLYTQKIPIRQIAKELKLSYGTVYRFIQVLKRQQQIEAGLGGQ